MIRRTALTALAGAALLPLHRAAAQSDRGTMSAAQLRQAALQGGGLALQTSRLAQSQAELQAVKTFAEFEIAEQTAVMQAMRIGDIDVPDTVELQGEKASILTQLSGQRGAAFDRMYIQAQQQGHQELLQIYSMIANNAGSDEERIIGTLAVPSIRQHIAILNTIQSQLRG